MADVAAAAAPAAPAEKPAAPPAEAPAADAAPAEAPAKVAEPYDFEPPAASVRKIVKGALPDGVKMGADTTQAFAKAAGIFIHYLTTCANDFCRENKRATITANDIVAALKELEFEEMVEPLQKFLELHRAAESEKKAEKAKAKEAAEQKEGKAEPAADKADAPAAAPAEEAAADKTDAKADDAAPAAAEPAAEEEEVMDVEEKPKEE
uniref:Transcription factor CBF/NF-Y/archaeal histone domain-containing protein n=1 Tax=Phaeomonas parva TaxID=124430 RepID=A0A7S1UF20_9STRA|mmetsp:Transcript_44759/g.140356  ORF Transcript_44759/g.140356 Transcript_44759/m.140356 type:complete len:208 (+) Transcript_44759:202-825(+)|eukprot:CAMPEP_0118854990 /NCGR_PEP_ID=MMETSP1163-20130328/2972_1 /TAXON_ID=124430 /ORGANISM="Phaeomonas parva, Strain CCMP2877" /LENGTH=207 /DNA_ID=CAMNT_0006787795 /DNA_START=360 /DNA_END=983 /DNA_ORIENTATION=+